MPENLGLEFKVERSDLVDAILEPDGGIALVELYHDPQVLLGKLAILGEDVIPETPSERRYDWQTRLNWRLDFENTSRKQHDLRAQFPEVLPDCEKLALELQALYNPISRAATGGVTPYSWLYLVAQRRASSGPNGHNDDIQLNAWLGSTKPGLMVLRDGKWIAVDNIPPNHALIWRGEDMATIVDDNMKPLAPVRHRANYRGKQRRYTLMGWTI